MKAESINTVAVLGLGTMGHSIAQTFAAAGCRARCYDQLPRARDTLAERIRANLERMTAAGVGDAGSVEETLGRVEVFDTESQALDGAQFVTEAIAEDLALKQEVFARLESQVDARTILASNSSSFPITDIAVGMRRPERAIL
ncbi:MAG: 3-hydroxyacyl-CoA dehydrogenase family protein, partial [Planctomycetota bacterium]